MAPAQREPKVVVLGGGSWGTTVASICARRGPTLQWVRSEETANDINEKHRNSRYLGNEVQLALTLTATTDFSEAADNFKAYAVKGHRHHPEILESLTTLEGVSGHSLGLTFVPHLVPMVRGILATIYARITKEADFQALFEKRYASEPFVDVLPPGSQPETRWVRGTNQCRIAIHRPFDADTLVVLAVEDNLVKGAAGQAVQNMNLMFGFPEKQALDQIAVVP